MPNLLGVTNPVPGFDGTSNRGMPVTVNDPQIQNVPDPGRVSRPDPRSEREDSGSPDNPGKLRYDSNLQTFLRRLREEPTALASLSRLLSGRQGAVVLSGLREGTAAELSQVLEMLRMDEGELLGFLLQQLRGGNRFGGALFAMLRSAYDQAGSEGMRDDILQFLKCYVDYSSTAHLERNMLRDLRGIGEALPERWAGRIHELAAQMENGIAAGDRAGNLRLLQREVFPHVAAYVERTHDIGAARGFLTMLALNMARYENGSTQNLFQAFYRLSGYSGLKERLGGIDDASLLMLLEGNELAKSAQRDPFAQHLTAVAARALRGEGSADTQELFRNLVNSILLNESVYMSVNHALVPLEWNGRMLFSELWVDPNAEEPEQKKEQSPRTVKVLLKMDVQELGFFDVLLVGREREVSVSISCPERVAPFAKRIERAVSDILTRHELTPGTVQVRKLERPLTLTEVFPKLFEGKNGVDIKI